MTTLEVLGFFRGLWPLDFLLTRPLTPKTSDEIVLVVITEPDYAEWFRSTSPLAPATVAKLISKVRTELNPKVIGVDLDTQDGDAWDSVFDPVQVKADGDQCPPNETPPIFWAQVPVDAQRLKRPRPGGPLLLGAVRHRTFLCTERMGIPEFPQDPDGVIRRHEAEFPVIGKPRSAPEAEPKMDSLSRALAKFYNPSAASKENDYLLRFPCRNSCFDVVTANELLGEPAKDRYKELQGKIVLIGGDYSAARDRYRMPKEKFFGVEEDISGVELVARAIQADLDERLRVHVVGRWVIALLDFLIGTLLVLAFFFGESRPYRTFWVALLTSLGLAVLISFVAFHWWSYWVNFIPIVAAVNLHQVWDHSRHLKEREKEIREEEEKHKKRPPRASPPDAPRSKAVSS